MEMRDGKLYGPDPNEYFCGSPYDEDSFGIYAKGLLKALDRAAGTEFCFKDESGTPIQKLLEKYTMKLEKYMDLAVGCQKKINIYQKKCRKNCTQVIKQSQILKKIVLEK